MTHSFLALTLASIFCFTTAQADTHSSIPAGEYALDKTHASIIWKVSHLGLSNYAARFTDFDATLNYNPQNPEQSSVEVTINPLSVRTDYPGEKDFDGKLATGEGWFNGNNFPEITFTSTEVTRTSEKTGTLTGNLTFLGVTKPLTLDVTYNTALNPHPFMQLPAIGFSATGMLKRSEWGMETYLPAIGDDVEIQIEVEFVQAAN